MVVQVVFLAGMQGINGGTITLNNVYSYGVLTSGAKAIGYNVDGTLNINNSYFPKAGNAGGAYNLAAGSANPNNVDYASPGGNWDATQAGGTIGKAGTLGENLWTTNVTPWTLSTYSGGNGCPAGGGGGDPYIRTFDGELYKLDNISGFCRMLQGNLHSKNFVLNVEMKIDSKENRRQHEYLGKFSTGIRECTPNGQYRFGKTKFFYTYVRTVWKFQNYFLI